MAKAMTMMMKQAPAVSALQLRRDQARALEAGCAYQSHMARWMRRVLGVTPMSGARPRGGDVR
jgi:hypothetical protein